MSGLEKMPNETRKFYISSIKARHNADCYNNIDNLVTECMREINSASLLGKYDCIVEIPRDVRRSVSEKLSDVGFKITFHSTVSGTDRDKIRIFW